MEASTTRSHGVKHRFTPQEDALIKELVETVGIKGWREVAARLPGLGFRQVRERYVNYIQQHTAIKEWTREEDDLLLQKYQELGSKWSRMAPLFPGRTDVHLRNRMRLLLRRMKKSEAALRLPEIPTRQQMSPASSPIPVSAPSGAPLGEQIMVEEADFDVFFDDSEFLDSVCFGELSI